MEFDHSKSCFGIVKLYQSYLICGIPYLYDSKTVFGIVNLVIYPDMCSCPQALKPKPPRIWKFQNCLSLAKRLRKTDFYGYNAWNINVPYIWKLETHNIKQHFYFWYILINIQKVNTTKLHSVECNEMAYKSTDSIFKSCFIILFLKTTTNPWGPGPLPSPLPPSHILF